MMIKENKLKYIISLIVIVLPSVVALFIKGSVGNMMKGAWYFSWIMPLVFAALHTGLLILTRHIDKVKQGKKIENITFFMLPGISLYVGSIFIAIMLGAKLNIGFVTAFLMGIAFIVMGNYIPKAKRNHTFGFKIRWTVANDDNWVATHRLSGKLLVIAGIVMLIASLLPVVAMFIIFVVVIVAICVIPTVYSYNFYKKQIASGEATKEDYRLEKTVGKKGVAATVITIVATCLLICVLMTTGGLKYEFDADSLNVKPSFGGALDLKYSDLKDATIEYRNEKVPGTRVMGYGSPKLLYGQFQNDEFGNYTRYTYTNSTSAIIIRTSEGVIVLAGQTSEETFAIYSRLLLEKANAT